MTAAMITSGRAGAGPLRHRITLASLTVGLLLACGTDRTPLSPTGRPDLAAAAAAGRVRSDDPTVR